MKRSTPAVLALAALLGIPSVASAADAPGAPVVAASEATASAHLPDELLSGTTAAAPATALHVAPSGSYRDTSGATVATPYRTITAAVAKAPVKGTVVVHAGVYRETIGVLSKTLTIQAAAGERAWVVGTDLLPASDFERAGSAWVFDGWTFEPTCRDPRAEEVAGGDAPTRTAEAVFVDGVAQRQVASADEVTRGTFYVDRAADALYVGTDPSTADVEATTREYALNIKAPGAVVRGLGFARMAVSADQGCKPGMIWTNPGATGAVLEDDTFLQSSADGVAIRSADAVVRGSTFSDNGFRGISAYKAYGLQVVGNTLAGSNAERFQATGAYGAAAAMKITYSGWNATDRVQARTVITDNVLRDNAGRGIWCDLDCGSTLIARNVVERSALDGIFFEVSHGADIVSNVLVGNGAAGVRIGGSHDVRLINNTATDNLVSWSFLQDPRRWQGTSSVCFPAPAGAPAAYANTCTTGNVTMLNNLSQHTKVIAGTGPCGASDVVTGLGLYTCNGTAADGDAGEMFATMDNNAYVRTPLLVGTRLLKWALPGWRVTFTVDLGPLQQNTRFERRGSSLIRVSNVLADVPRGDFRVVAPELRSSGAPLPADLASELGVATSPVPVGAFAW